jgi:TNF receptor-associated protein 1
LNGKLINTISALWLKEKHEISEQEHHEFYKFISQSYDIPLYRLHFHHDVPLGIHSLFYFPEKARVEYGVGESGVSLYSRKVLIQAKSKDIIPEWLRFLRGALSSPSLPFFSLPPSFHSMSLLTCFAGVVDCEDIPLNISRESMQDSNLIRKLRKIISGRIVKFLEEQAKNDPEKYFKFYSEFSNYFKQGICTDFDNKVSIKASHL